MRADVDAAPLRAALRRSPLTNGEIGRRLGVTEVRARRLRAGVCYTGKRTARGYEQYPIRSHTYEFAVRLCRALDLDPIDYDL